MILWHHTEPLLHTSCYYLHLMENSKKFPSISARARALRDPYNYRKLKIQVQQILYISVYRYFIYFGPLASPRVTNCDNPLLRPSNRSINNVAAFFSETFVGSRSSRAFLIVLDVRNGHVQVHSNFTASFVIPPTHFTTF